MVDEELEPLITRCPNCQTQFRVTENQLAVASGRVRCGACLTVFQGIEHLILDEESTSFSTGSEADAALDALLDELEPGSERTFPAEATEKHASAGAAGAVRFYGGYEDVAQTREVTRVDIDAVDENDEVDGVDEDEKVDGIDEIEGTAEVAHTHEACDAEVDAEPTIDAQPDVLNVTPATEDSEAPVGERPEVTDGDAEDATAISEPDSCDPDEDYDRWIGRTASIDALVDEVVASGRAAARHRSGAASQDTGGATGSLLEAARAASPISFAPEPRRWWAAVVALLFVVLLLIQIAYLQLPDWSREPSLRPAYELVCGWFGCELPEMRALSALRTRNLVVRSHPRTSGALIVDAAIVNTAPFAQRFPDLELRFTSVTGELVAGRRFTPDEYLPKDFEGERAMPPDTPIQVSLEIVDPGPDAVNYTLSFR